MSQQDWILPWSLTLHRAPCSPQLSVYIGGLPRSFPRAPKHLQLRCRREWLFGRGDVHVYSPPLKIPPKFLRLQTHQLSSANPQSTHRNLGAPFSLFGCNKQVIVYLLEALLQHKELMKLLVNLLKSEGIIWVSCKRKENDPSGVESPTAVRGAIFSALFHVIYRNYSSLNHSREISFNMWLFVTETK